MAPKTSDSGSADAASFKFIFAVLKHNKATIEPAWDEVAREVGIAHGRNAGAKFKDLIKKHGYKLEAGKIMPNDDSMLPAHTPKKVQASKKKAKVLASNKKRKLAMGDDEDEEEVELKDNSAKEATENDVSGDSEENGSEADELA